MIVKLLSHWKNSIILQLLIIKLRQKELDTNLSLAVQIKTIKTNSNHQRMKRGELGIVGIVE